MAWSKPYGRLTYWVGFSSRTLGQGNNTCHVQYHFKQGIVDAQSLLNYDLQWYNKLKHETSLRN